jgi:Cft2 family RNA processing exonuclease
MERQIYDRLPTEEACKALTAIPMSPNQVYRVLPFNYRSIRKAMHRLRTAGFVEMMERDGREFLYARKAGSSPPVDGRGGSR